MAPWWLLGLAIISEVIGTTALRWSNDAAGAAKFTAYATVVIGYVLSFWLLALVLKKLELGIAYAVWAGVGTAVTAIVGVWLFGESMTAIKVGSTCPALTADAGLRR